MRNVRSAAKWLVTILFSVLIVGFSAFLFVGRHEAVPPVCLVRKPPVLACALALLTLITPIADTVLLLLCINKFCSQRQVCNADCDRTLGRCVGASVWLHSYRAKRLVQPIHPVIRCRDGS